MERERETTTTAQTMPTAQLGAAHCPTLLYLRANVAPQHLNGQNQSQNPNPTTV
jgi:hypothetical protein